MIEKNTKVIWRGPGGEAFGIVTGHIQSPNGNKFLCVKWDEEKGSLQYAEMMVIRFIEPVSDEQINKSLDTL